MFLPARLFVGFLLLCFFFACTLLVLLRTSLLLAWVFVCFFSVIFAKLSCFVCSLDCFAYFPACLPACLPVFLFVFAWLVLLVVWFAERRLATGLTKRVEEEQQARRKLAPVLKRALPVVVVLVEMKTVRWDRVGCDGTGWHGMRLVGM